MYDVGIRLYDRAQTETGPPRRVFGVVRQICSTVMSWF